MLDCVIVGGGAAGLAAATYLARFRRDFLLIDSGSSRLNRIPRTRNTPGYPQGIAGRDLYARLREQAHANGATLIYGTVTGLKRSLGQFEIASSAGAYVARTILLATGTYLVDPMIEGLDAAIASGLVRYCPICDGFEARDRRIAVLAADEGALDEARFLQTYSHDVTYVPANAGARLGPAATALAARRGIKVAGVATELRIVDGVVDIAFVHNEHARFDILYPCLGCTPQNQLARGLGASLSATGGLLTDHHQRTDVSGLYAAGDVLQGLDQIAPAFGQAAIAATAIHNDLAEAGS